MKILAKAANVAVSLVLIAILALTAFMAFTARRSPDGISTAGGYKILNVISGSMEPAIRTGDVILVRPLTQEDQIQEGDVITFRTQEDASMLITHRVVGVVSVNDEATAYITKGDANDSPDDTPVTRQQVLGRYAHRIPLLGYLGSFVRKPIGAVLLIILPGLILIAGEVRKMVRIIQEEEAAKQTAPPAQ